MLGEWLLIIEKIRCIFVVKSALWEVREIVKVVVVCWSRGVKVDRIITSRQLCFVAWTRNVVSRTFQFATARCLKGARKLSIQQILVIINLFCGNICEYSQIRYQAQFGEERLSYKTIADWLSYCREICLEINGPISKYIHKNIHIHGP